MIMPAAASATMAPRGVRRLGVGVVAGCDLHAGRQDFGLQCLVLQRVEIAGLRITTGGLPAGDHSAGGFIELAVGLDVEAEAGEAALHVAALAAVEAELIWLASSVNVAAGANLVTVGYGKTKPKDSNAPLDPVNRRVQVVNMETKTASK